jgi:RNA polymerase-binding protein DksA
MKPEKRERYRKRLDDMRLRVAGQAEHVTEGIREDLSPPGNNSSAPVHLADFAMDSIDADAKVLAAERDLLGHIDAALIRIDDGSYGNCERCGQAIGEERLNAVPYTARCADCADAEETGDLSPDDVQED